MVLKLLKLIYNFESGNLEGTQQSGNIDLKLPILLPMGPIIEEARKSAIALLEDDPNLSHPRIWLCVSIYQYKRKNFNTWGKIS